MAANLLLPIEYLRECFLYDPATGRFWWKQRPVSHFPSDEVWKDWNDQHAGVETFLQDNDGYLRAEVRRDGKRMRLAAGRLAFALAYDFWPETVDHINGDTRDNRLENLRAATNQQQQWNRFKTKRPDKLRGAFWDRTKWVASVEHNRKKIRLGRFDTEIEAHEAYCAFVRENRGEFANTGA
jgi:hypothetical protein